ncbi:MAG TPA: response regulator transcription factor [Jatrophihabitans sp.]|jgi:DNA-binding NarL/FixJ family response regulator|nr:response regulator transcription factor [Jatrophihabitans sp.]
MTDEIRIVLVDDHNLFRAGVAELLRSVPGFVVEAEGASGTDAIALCRQLHPHVLIMDVEMPGPGAQATVQQVSRDSPSTRIIVLTMHDNGELVRELISSGASAYLHKSAGQAELSAAVNSVMCSPDQVLVAVSRASMLGPDRPDPTLGLVSARELEVLALLAQGMSNSEIAAKLFISDSTVKRHLTNVYAKLGAVSRVDAVRKAQEANLLAQPGPAG